MSRYARQEILPEIGAAGQAVLRGSHVVVVGAGGLASPLLSYLAGAGLGHLTIVDDDRVEESNLHRQTLYRMADIGRSKADAARERIAEYNPEIRVTVHACRLEPANAAVLCAEADVIIDAADSFAVTYILSDHCLASGQTLVSASVVAFSGYVGCFCGGRAPSVRAIFPDLPRSAGNCATSGVIGPAVGIIGSLQAQMALNCLLNIEPSPLGRMLSLEMKRLTVSSFSFAGAEEPEAPLRFLSVGEIGPDDILVELRGPEEAPKPFAPRALRMATDEVAALAGEAGACRIVLCCRTGLRAWNAALGLREAGHGNLALIAAG